MVRKFCNAVIGEDMQTAMSLVEIPVTNNPDSHRIETVDGHLSLENDDTVIDGVTAGFVTNVPNR